MRLLSQRGHSEAELRHQFMVSPCVANARFGISPLATSLGDGIEAAIIEQLITYCYQHNWLDDQRFANGFIASSRRKGYGVQRIRSELIQKGIEK